MKGQFLSHEFLLTHDRSSGNITRQHGTRHLTSVGQSRAISLRFISWALRVASDVLHRWFADLMRCCLTYLTTWMAVMVCSLPAQPPMQRVEVRIAPTLQALLQDEDTDHDKRITIDDPHITGTERGDKRFWITSTDNSRYEVSGTYYLSNLLQELKLAEDEGNKISLLKPERIFEPPADRISRMIREVYWDGLTRRVDETGLMKIVEDEKTTTAGGFSYVYVPANDKLAFDYFTDVAKRHPQERLNVVRLPKNVSGEYVRQLDGRHGILSLGLHKAENGQIQGIPFVVPGGRFNEMYGWDSYFITLGLLDDGKIELAKSMVDNLVYEITHYGKILNANRTYYLTRSQPPFLTSMIRAVYERLPRNDPTKNWLKSAISAAIEEYRNVWMSKEHLTKTGLSRYFDSGSGQPPEVEPGHFDPIYREYASRYKMEVKEFEAAYRSGKIKVPELDEYFVHDRAMRESGHDTSYRLIGRCANLTTVDLNSLLYKIEMDIATLLENEFGGELSLNGRQEKSLEWKRSAQQRKELVNRYCWNEERGMFFDYDIVKGEQTLYESATSFYPMWAGLATEQQAKALIKYALPKLELSGGVVSTTEASRGPITADRPQRQWDYPYGWAPHQIIVWQAMRNCNHPEIARRLICRWLYTITSNAANYNGTVPEKFNVVTRSHQVFAEYGNVGTKFAYITREGFGWTNASFQIGLRQLPSNLREHLDRLIPPEWIFEQ
jgi:alpha,alpha-trehalase